MTLLTLHSTTLHLPDAEATRRAGLTLGRALAPAQYRGAIVLCTGALGAGKTTFIKAACEALGIDPRSVTSPTYTLVNIYPGPPAVYHVDLYRLEFPEALLEMDRDDWINPDGPTFIEWPEIARPLLEGETLLELTFEHGSAQAPGAATGGRTLTLVGPAEPYGAVLAAVVQSAQAAPDATGEG